MLTLDQMELADCYTPQDLTDEIFRQLPDLVFPIPIRELALANGIRGIIDIKDPSDEISKGISIKELPEGFLISAANDNGVIFYKDNPIAPYRKLFTIAHEFGHHLFPHHTNKRSFDDLSKPVDPQDKEENDLIEDEANIFARLLLLPESLLIKELGKREFSLESLQELAEFTQTSFSFLANRCCTIIDDFSFVLITTKDRVCTKIRSNSDELYDEFKRLKGQKMPSGSHFFQRKEVFPQHITNKVAVDPLVWLSTDYKNICSDASEQTFYQLKGYAITLVMFN